MTMNPLRLDEVCFVIINLDRRPDRRRHMAEQFNGLLRPRFVSAIDGTTLSSDRIGRDGFIVPANRFMTSSEIACTLSHKRALETFLETDQSLGLVLEDDAIIDFAALSRVQVPSGITFDFLKLQGLYYDNRSAVRTVSRTNGLEVFCRPELSMGSSAYLVTRPGARTMIAAISRRLAPADFYLAYHFQHGLRGFEVKPAPVRILDDLASDISVDRPNYVEPRFNLRFTTYRIRKAVSNNYHWWRFGRDLRRAGETR